MGDGGLVGPALTDLQRVLLGFVQRRLFELRGEDWLRAVNDCKSHSSPKIAAGDPVPTDALIATVRHLWNSHFQQAFELAVRGEVLTQLKEVRRLRNKAAHQAATPEELTDLVDTIEQLMSHIRESERIENIRALRAAVLPSGPSVVPPLVEGNPKPIASPYGIVSDVVLLCGNHSESMDVTARYVHEPLDVPHELGYDMYRMLSIAKQNEALEKGFPYFNGPNTRLIRATEERTHQASSGEERRGLTLELGPVSWEQYTVLNGCLDVPIFPGERPSIRSRLANPADVYENGLDLRWCRLGNILTLACVPITSDGFGIVQERSNVGVSSDFGLFTTGVAENIHRFLDEAVPHDLMRPLPADGSLRPVDAHYRPRGVPSPFLTAIRGVEEELSPALAQAVRGNPAGVRFLNVVFDLVYFQPVLSGIIDLGLPRVQVERLIAQWPGKDHSEHKRIVFVPLDFDDPFARGLITDPDAWYHAALAALVCAVNYRKAQLEA